MDISPSSPSIVPPDIEAIDNMKDIQLPHKPTNRLLFASTFNFDQSLDSISFAPTSTPTPS